MGPSLFTKAILNFLFFSIALSSPLLPRQDADEDGQNVAEGTCPALDTEDPNELASFNGQGTPTAITSIALPDAGYLSIHESEDDDPEDDVDPDPSTGTVDAAQAAGLDPSKAILTATTHDKRYAPALYERSGTRRLFQASNYRVVAEAGLVIMLSSLGGGAIGILGDLIGNLPALPPGVSSWWQADHVLELGQIKYFLTTWMANAANNHGATWDWNDLWTHVSGCEGAKSAMTFILNRPANLVGIPSEINNLKGLLINFKNAGADWEKLTGQGLVNYLQFVQPQYMATAQHVGNLLNRVAAGVWENANTDVAGSPGSFFITFATAAFNRALGNARVVGSSGAVTNYERHSLT